MVQAAPVALRRMDGLAGAERPGHCRSRHIAAVRMRTRKPDNDVLHALQRLGFTGYETYADASLVVVGPQRSPEPAAAAGSLPRNGIGAAVSAGKVGCVRPSVMFLLARTWWFA